MGEVAVKKLVIFLWIALIFMFMMPIEGFSTDEGEYDYQVIPDEAIRLRILANSDSEEDQAIKRLVRDRVNEEVTSWVAHMTDIEEARSLIENNIDEVEAVVGEVLEEEGAADSFTVEYGKNILFPAKIYDNFLYPQGEYEAILITIGEGEGSNWWCVLFPPLCFLDFSFGSTVQAEEQELDEEEKEDEEKEKEEEKPKVKFFLFELFGWS